MRKRIILALVHNQNAVLPRVTGMFTKHQFQIESISAGYTEIEDVSKVTLTVEVHDVHKFKQLLKQLNKQIDVLQIIDITEQDVVSRELALIKFLSNGQTRAEIISLLEPFRASIIDVSKDSVSVQVTGGSKKIEALIQLLRPYGIKEIARSGIIAFTRENFSDDLYRSRVFIRGVNDEKEFTT